MTIDRAQVPQIFIDHIGTWQGEYIKTDSQGHFLRSFTGTFTVTIEGQTYTQTNDYKYSDGKQLSLSFSGEFQDGILKMSSGSYGAFAAEAWDSGQNTIMFVAQKKQDEILVRFIETITLISPTHRVRSTQEFHDNVFSGINFIEEHRLD